MIRLACCWGRIEQHHRQSQISSLSNSRLWIGTLQTTSNFRFNSSSIKKSSMQQPLSIQVQQETSCTPTSSNNTTYLKNPSLCQCRWKSQTDDQSVLGISLIRPRH